MTEKYILDGYNVIGKIRELREIQDAKGLESSREALAKMLSDIKRRRANIEFLVVFDGKAGEMPGDSKTSLRGITCCFTRTGEEADDYIGALLRNIKDRRGVVVISNDNKVRNIGKAYSVDIRQPSTLLETAKPRARTAADTDDKAISQQAANDITRWYKEKIKNHNSY